MNEKINQTNIFQRLLFHLTYTIKVQRLEVGLESPLLDRRIFSRFNQLVLGGRVKTVLCGGAVLSDETQRFAQAALCVKVFQGYGLTETCAAGTIADRKDFPTIESYLSISCEIFFLKNMISLVVERDIHLCHVKFVLSIGRKVNIERVINPILVEKFLLVGKSWRTNISAKQQRRKTSISRKSMERDISVQEISEKSFLMAL